MPSNKEIRQFYLAHIPGAREEGPLIKAPCPFCRSDADHNPGTLAVYMDPESFFMGYFRCSNRCIPGGFAPYFARIMGIEPQRVPGFDPDREPYVRDIVFPPNNLAADIRRFMGLMRDQENGYFEEFGVSKSVIREMNIGYNGRYLVYPYFQEDGKCYSAHCRLPNKEEDHFWHGNEAFFGQAFQVYNAPEIERCEDGSLFIVEGENNLLTLKELGYPGIAVPSFADLETIDLDRLAFIHHVFLVTNLSPEARVSARYLAGRLGFKARIIQWPSHLKRGYNLCQLSRDKGKDFRSAVSTMIKRSKSFSPFSSVEKEQKLFEEFLERGKGKALLGLSSGFEKMDQALNGIRGINIMGGPPKAGKSCFFMQLSTETARKQTPVIYYDFENGRQKIYTRTLCRLSRLSQEKIRLQDLEPDEAQRLESAYTEFKNILSYFRVVTDRKLSPDIMRRHIDFIQKETHRSETLVVLDSLHKLPFKDLSERRTGIDEWLRHLETIRDEQNVAFLVISELSRGEGGRYSKKPDLGSFKESGDIEYSADNAMILMPDWDPVDPISKKERESSLYLVASREDSPGKIATYVLEYPFWGFREI
ncbi:MAG: AAA family ATPase [Deltaproteobacteria bacterium]|nr:AAA family ATPase [Deltaproteobacteria bacterium]